MRQTPNEEAVGMLKSLPRHVLSLDSKDKIATALRTEVRQLHCGHINVRASRGTHRRNRIWMGVLGGIAGACLLMAGAVQFVPKIGVYAQAALPGLLGVPPALLKYDPGLQLVGSTNQVESIGVSDQKAGYTVEVLGAYSDDNRTVVFLKTMNSQGQAVDMRPENMILTDQFGLRYDPQSGNASTEDPGFQYYTFKTVNPVDRQLGVHFTLQIIGLMDGKTLGQVANVTGPWTLNWIENSFPKSQVLTPDTVDSDAGTQLKLSQAVIAPSSLCVVFNVSTNFVFSNNQPPAGAGSAFYMELTGPDGKVVQSLGGQNSGQFSNGHLTDGTVEGTFAPISKSGTYSVHIHGHLFGQIQGEWTFKFDVP